MKRVARTILVSAGEASGDFYASLVVRELRRAWPDARFFGCTGPHLRAAGVETVVDSASLSVVGLLEVAGHLPRIYGEYRKLVQAAGQRRPDLALLTDSPDFHLRLARQARRIAASPSHTWSPLKCGHGVKGESARFAAWSAACSASSLSRSNSSPAMELPPRISDTRWPDWCALRSLARRFFGNMDSIPLVHWLQCCLEAAAANRPAICLRSPMPCSRLAQERDLNFALPASATAGAAFFRRLGVSPITVIEGESWDAMAHAAVALAASGTVTVEAALLGVPMATFYKVTPISWLLGKMLVDVPYYSMVNLIAGRALVPELMQGRMTGENLAREALRLLDDAEARS